MGVLHSAVQLQMVVAPLALLKSLAFSFVREVGVTLASWRLLAFLVGGKNYNTFVSRTSIRNIPAPKLSLFPNEKEPPPPLPFR